MKCNTIVVPTEILFQKHVFSHQNTHYPVCKEVIRVWPCRLSKVPIWYDWIRTKILMSWRQTTNRTTYSYLEVTFWKTMYLSNWWYQYTYLTRKRSGSLLQKIKVPKFYDYIPPLSYSLWTYNSRKYYTTCPNQTNWKTWDITSR